MTISTMTRPLPGPARQPWGSTTDAVSTWRGNDSMASCRQASPPSTARRSGSQGWSMPASGRRFRVVTTCRSTSPTEIPPRRRLTLTGSSSRSGSKDGSKTSISPGRSRDASQDALVVRLMERLETVQETTPFPLPLREGRGALALAPLTRRKRPQNTAHGAASAISARDRSTHLTAGQSPLARSATGIARTEPQHDHHR